MHTSEKIVAHIWDPVTMMFLFALFCSVVLLLLIFICLCVLNARAKQIIDAFMLFSRRRTYDVNKGIKEVPV